MKGVFSAHPMGPMASEVPPQGQSSAVSYICEQNSRKPAFIVMTFDL